MKFKFALVLFGLIFLTSTIFASSTIDSLRAMDINQKIFVSPTAPTDGYTDLYVDNIYSFNSPTNLIINHASNIFLQDTLMGGDVGFSNNAYFYKNVFFDLGIVNFSSKVNINSKAYIKELNVGKLGQIDDLKGKGNAYVCVNSQGELYRSLRPCIHTGNSN